MADEQNPDGTISEGPRGRIEIGPITTQATAAPPIAIPDFIAKRNVFAATGSPASRQIANFIPKLGPNQKIEDLALQTVDVFDLNFCGKKFAAIKYGAFADFARGTKVRDITIQGVGRTLATKLIAAQEEIFRAFARERIGAGQPFDSESAFDTWCGLVQSNGGYGFRNGPHFGGSAVDLNTTGCPYVATGRLVAGPNGPVPDNTLGGEVRSDHTKPQKAALRTAFSDALLVYDRAVKFVNGDNATFDLGPQSSGETAFQIHGRFLTVSDALAAYFAFAFTRRATVPKVLAVGELHAPDDIDVFVQRVSAEFDRDPTDPNGFAQTHPSFKSGMSGNRKSFLTPLLEQIRQDHETLRLVMVQGSMQFSPDPSGSLVCDISKLVTRDPCFGFLSLRREIVEALLAEGLRWGAAGFSRSDGKQDTDGGPTLLANGDMMHFDLGFKVNPDLKPDPNPDQLGYKIK